LIIGAGIGGLAAGVALRRAGWHARIFERAASPRELGFALSLAPNAIVALRELGLAEPVIAEGSVIGDAEVRHANGKLIKRFNVAAGLAYASSVFVLRSVLHGTLLNAIEPENLVLSSEAVGFEVSDTGVVLNLKDGRSETGDVLIGADGIGSTLRRFLHPHEPLLRSSGYYGIRGVAYDVGQHLGNLSVVAYFGPGIEAATIRANKHAVYWYMSLLAEDVHADARMPHTIIERWAGVLEDGFRAITQATRPEDLRLDELCDRDPIDDWGRGAATLLGDAAHPMLPHTGQGAAQALEDAVALGLALASGDDPIRSLRRYERVRSPRTRIIVKRGRRIAKLTTTKSTVVSRLRTAALRLVPMRPMVAAFMVAGRRDPHRALRSSTVGR